MPKKKSTSKASLKANRPELVLQIRLLCGDVIALGPGKADLLEHLAETGSLQASAARMNMSNMKAWRLVKDMNSCFREPLVLAARGGSEQGGSQLTDSGREVLQLYRAMQRDADNALKARWRLLEKKLA